MSARWQSLLVLASLMSLTACASFSPNGRSQVMLPSSLSAAYSEVELQFQLAGSFESEPCAGEECVYARAFDRQVQRIGSRLAQAAFDAYPDLSSRIEKFEFIVADKLSPGAVSSANGKVVIFRGIHKLRLDEAALAFVIAREMARVIAGHHDENSTVSILFSVLAQVLLPVANLARGAVAVIQSNSWLTATATSAASYAGSSLVKSGTRDGQVEEADAIAFSLLGKLGWSSQEVSDALAAAVPLPRSDPWLAELRLAARSSAP